MGAKILNKDNSKKDITEGKSFFAVNNFFKKKENLYLLEVFGLAGLLLDIEGSIFTTSDKNISYFLALISSALIINGYNQVKKGNNP